MRTLVRLMKLVLLVAYLLVRFFLSIVVVNAAIKEQWGILIGMAIVVVWLFVKEDDVYDWAEFENF